MCSRFYPTEGTTASHPQIGDIVFTTNLVFVVAETSLSHRHYNKVEMLCGTSASVEVHHLVSWGSQRERLCTSMPGLKGENWAPQLISSFPRQKRLSNAKGRRSSCDMSRRVPTFWKYLLRCHLNRSRRCTSVDWLN